MPLYVVAWPRFSAQDLALLEDVRARFDPQHGRIAPHLTLVFATERLDVPSLAAHVGAVTRGHSPFDCTFRAATVQRGAPGDATHVFLVPREGYAEIDRLHGALYTGPLAPDLRRDIPFIPHVTVAQVASEERAREIAASLGQEMALYARVERLDVLVASDDAIVSARAIPLG
jgi:2'-5' RNA ligase